MGIAISKIIQALEPSATLAMAAKAREVKAAGKPVFDFSVGEPDFTTPAHICEAAVKAMKDGHTHYTASGGINELRSTPRHTASSTRRSRSSSPTAPSIRCTTRSPCSAIRATR